MLGAIRTVPFLHHVCRKESRCLVINNLRHRRESTSQELVNVRQISTGVPRQGWFENGFTSLSESSAVATTQSLLEAVHSQTGLPWWATIALTTISLRLVITLPLAAYQHRIAAKLANLKPEMDELVVELKKETSAAVRMFKWDEKTAQYHFRKSAKKQWDMLVQRENCHQAKASILLWGQVPLWICMSVALRNMAMMLPHNTHEAFMVYVSLSNGGFGWIPNLTDVDHALILPVSMALANLAIIQLQTLTRTGAASFFSQSLTNVFRVLCVAMIPIAAYAPSDVVLYWTVSSFYGLAQNLVLLSPKVRRLFRIPQTTTEIQQPYRNILAQIKGSSS